MTFDPSVTDRFQLRNKNPGSRIWKKALIEAFRQARSGVPEARPRRHSASRVVSQPGEHDLERHEETLEPERDSVIARSCHRDNDAFNTDRGFWRDAENRTQRRELQNDELRDQQTARPAHLDEQYAHRSRLKSFEERHEQKQGTYSVYQMTLGQDPPNTFQEERYRQVSRPVIREPIIREQTYERGTIPPKRSVVFPRRTPSPVHRERTVRRGRSISPLTWVDPRSFLAASEGVRNFTNRAAYARTYNVNIRTAKPQADTLMTTSSTIRPPNKAYSQYPSRSWDEKIYRSSPILEEPDAARPAQHPIQAKSNKQSINQLN